MILKNGKIKGSEETGRVRPTSGLDKSLDWAVLWMYCQTDQTHKYHNALVSYSTIQHSKQKCAHFYSEWCIVEYGPDTFWDL